MAHEPAAIEREIDEIRDDLDGVADELDARIAAFRQKVSARYILRHHPLAVAVAFGGLMMLLGAMRALRRRHYRKHLTYCNC